VSATNPVRYPDTRSRPVMTRRAWLLVLLNVLIPGSAQSLAGDKRLGRVGLVWTMLGWALAVVAILVALLRRDWLFSLATNPWALGAGAVLLLATVVLWTVLTLDTLRLVKFVKVEPNRRLPIAGLALLVLAVILAGTAFVEVRAVAAIGVLQNVFGSGADIEDPVDGRYNILLLGGDAGPDRQGLRPDSMSVVSVDAETGEVVIFGLPRDLQYAPFVAGSPMAELYPDGYGWNGRCNVDFCQLNSVYTEVEVNSPELYPDAVAQGSLPGVEAMRDAAEGILGLEIPYYVLIDMTDFAALIDALGGIDVDVQERLPIEGGVNADGSLYAVQGWIEAGPQHLDGYHALWYARSRHTTSDYDRMRRQREVQEAILAQMDPANVLLRFQDIAAAGSGIVTTDIPQGMLGHFADLALKAKELPVTSLDFVPPDWYPADPDYAAIQAAVQELVGPEPTPAPEG